MALITSDPGDDPAFVKDLDSLVGLVSGQVADENPGLSQYSPEFGGKVVTRASELLMLSLADLVARGGKAA